MSCNPDASWKSHLIIDDMVASYIESGRRSRFLDTKVSRGDTALVCGKRGGAVREAAQMGDLVLFFSFLPASTLSESSFVVTLAPAHPKLPHTPRYRRHPVRRCSDVRARPYPRTKHPGIALVADQL